MGKNTTRLIANLGLLTAVSIVLTRFFGLMFLVGGAGVLRLSFGEIPLFLAGILFGPWAGALTGFVADLVGYFVNSYGGAWIPGVTIGAALTGLLPGLLLYKRRNDLLWWQVGLTVLITDLVAGVIWNTFWLSFALGTGFFVILPARLLARLITLPVYTVVLLSLARAHRWYLRSRS